MAQVTLKLSKILFTYKVYQTLVSKIATYCITVLCAYYCIWRISRRRHQARVVSRDTITYGESTRHQCLLLPSFRCRPPICSGKFAAAVAEEGKNFRLVNEIFNNETFPAPATKDVFTRKPPHVRTHLRRRRKYIYICVQ